MNQEGEDLQPDDLRPETEFSHLIRGTTPTGSIRSRSASRSPARTDHIQTPPPSTQIEKEEVQPVKATKPVDPDEDTEFSDLIRGPSPSDHPIGKDQISESPQLTTEEVPTLNHEKPATVKNEEAPHYENSPIVAETAAAVKAQPDIGGIVNDMPHASETANHVKDHDTADRQAAAQSDQYTDPDRLIRDQSPVSDHSSSNITAERKISQKSIREGAMALEQASPTLEARAKDSVTPRSTLDPRTDDLTAEVHDEEEEAKLRHKEPPPRPPMPTRANTLPGNRLPLEQKPTESVFAKMKKTVKRRVDSFKQSRARPPNKIVSSPSRSLSRSEGRSLDKRHPNRNTDHHIYANGPQDNSTNPFEDEDRIHATDAKSQEMSQPRISTPVIVPLSHQTFNPGVPKPQPQPAGQSRTFGPGEGYSQTLKPMDFSAHYQENRSTSPSLARSATMRAPKPKVKAQWYKQSHSIELPFTIKRNKKQAPRAPSPILQRSVSPIQQQQQYQTISMAYATPTMMASKPPLGRPPSSQASLMTDYPHRSGMAVISPVQQKPLSAEPLAVRQALTLRRGAPPPPPTMTKDGVALSGSSHQLTSLQNPELNDKVHRTHNLVADSLRRLITSSGPNASSQDGVSPLPYIMDEIAQTVYEKQLYDICDKYNSVSSDALDNQKAIDGSLFTIHPFLQLWKKGDGYDEPQKHYYDDGIDALKEYLQSCVNLRKVDLQGHYAAFHRPLDSFDRSILDKRAHLADWNDLPVLRQPASNTEFLELKGVAHDRLFYSTRSLNNMLVVWLSNNRTVSRSAVSAQKLRACLLNTIQLYHPVMLAVAYDRLLRVSTDQSSGLHLWSLCLRLAYLLTLQHFRESTFYYTHQIDTDPARVLIGLSSCNAFVGFLCTPDEAAEGQEHGVVDEDEEPQIPPQDGSPRIEALNNAAKHLCPSANDLDSAIEETIEAIYKDAESILHTMNITPVLLKALTPPDWIIEVVARICARKHPAAVSST